LGQKIKVQKYLLKQQLQQALENIRRYETAYKTVSQRYNDVLKQARQLNQSCNMQALLIASLIKEAGGTLEVKHESMNSFAKSRLTIDGKQDEERGVQILTYESTPIPQEELDRMEAMNKQLADAEKAQREAVEAAALAALPDCTDPDCKLPKDLKHKHDKPVVPVNDLGNTPAAQEQMDDLAEQADTATEAGVESPVAEEDGQPLDAGIAG